MNFGLNEVKTYTLQSQLSVFSLSFKKLNTLTYLIFSCFDFFLLQSYRVESVQQANCYFTFFTAPPLPLTVSRILNMKKLPQPETLCFW